MIDPRTPYADPAAPVIGAPALLGLSRDELVDKYAHLVKYVVGRLGVSVSGVFDREDAIQAGIIGLLAAIDNYRNDRGASFESYAILRIRGAILDAVRALDPLGRAAREAARAIARAIHELEEELGRSPEEEEIAGHLGLEVEAYRRQLNAASVVTVSIDELDGRNDDPDSALGESLPDLAAVNPEMAAEQGMLIAEMSRSITDLPERQQQVLDLYYQKDMTFKEIGLVLNVTESRVCQLHAEALIHLRSRLMEPEMAAALRFRRRRPA